MRSSSAAKRAKTNEYTLSHEESEVYDRQIRTWGLDTQFRIRNAKLCIVGINGLGAEVCKNMVLAGVGYLTLCDDAIVTMSDLSSNFFVTADDVGKNRASASCNRVQELNTRVKVNVESWKHTNDYANQFDIVCFTHVSPMFLQEALKHLIKPYIFIAQQYGLYGMYFINLREHFNYTKKTEKGENKSYDISFDSWNSSMSMPWDVIPSKFGRKNRKQQLVAEAFLCLRVIWKAWEQKGCDLNPDDLPNVLKLKQDCLKEYNLDEKWLPNATIRQMLMSFKYQIAPVCSVLGGSLSQQMITAISHKDMPYKNVIVYDASMSRSGIANLCQ